MSNDGEQSDRLLRTRALGADKERAKPCELGLLFRQLAEGFATIDDHFSTQDRCYLIFTTRRGRGQVRQLPLSYRTVLERALLLGDAQKVVASDVGRSTSTISARLKSALRFIGLSCGGSRVPVMLVLAAQDWQAPHPRSSGRLAPFVSEGLTRWVASVSRPDAILGQLLPAAEYDVARLLVEGKTHKEIANARGTSVRTVANQVRSVFQRLRISGRGELLHYLAAPPVANSET